MVAQAQNSQVLPRHRQPQGIPVYPKGPGHLSQSDRVPADGAAQVCNQAEFTKARCPVGRHFVRRRLFKRLPRQVQPLGEREFVSRLPAQDCGLQGCPSEVRREIPHKALEAGEIFFFTRRKRHRGFQGNLAGLRQEGSKAYDVHTDILVVFCKISIVENFPAVYNWSVFILY
jgi:hypothetical protein